MPHMPAEWLPHRAVWIGFPSDRLLWGEDLAPAQGQVAEFARAIHAYGKGEVVKLVCSDGEAADRAVAMSTGAEILIVPFFDIWLRDTGPIVTRDGDTLLALDYRGNGWGGKYPSPLDDAVGSLLSASNNLTRSPRSMILEGGAIDVDGAGLLVTTEQCLLNPNRNPFMARDDIAAQLKVDLAADQILWLGDGLTGDHTDGHVDNLARFVAPGVLALPEPDGRDDPNHDVYVDAWDRAKAFGVRTFALPSPGRVEADGEVIAASYMNFYIGNRTIVVPQHGVPNDQAAIDELCRVFPNRDVVGLPTDHILTGGGSFHCISQQVPA